MRWVEVLCALALPSTVGYNPAATHFELKEGITHD